MRVAIRKADGKILEAQSNDEAPMNALYHNVIEIRGYDPEKVEFTLMDEAEVMNRIEAQNEARKPAPVVVSMRQARAALIMNGLDEAVDAAVRAIPGIEGKLAVNDWDRATELRRDHPLVQALTPALGLTSEQLDALFVQASKL